MRKVLVLAEAAEDREQARDFYDAHEFGVGDYCADSLVADIESLTLITEFIPVILDFIACLLLGFRSEFIIEKPKAKRRSSPFWICGGSRIGFGKN